MQAPPRGRLLIPSRGSDKWPLTTPSPEMFAQRQVPRLLESWRPHRRLLKCSALSVLSLGPSVLRTSAPSLSQHGHTLRDIFSHQISRVQLAFPAGRQIQGWLMPLVPPQWLAQGCGVRRAGRNRVERDESLCSVGGLASLPHPPPPASCPLAELQAECPPLVWLLAKDGLLGAPS